MRHAFHQHCSNTALNFICAVFDLDPMHWILSCSCSKCSWSNACTCSWDFLFEDSHMFRLQIWPFLFDNAWSWEDRCQVPIRIFINRSWDRRVTKYLGDSPKRHMTIGCHPKAVIVQGFGSEIFHYPVTSVLVSLYKLSQICANQQMLCNHWATPMSLDWSHTPLGTLLQCVTGFMQAESSWPKYACQGSGWLTAMDAVWTAAQDCIPNRSRWCHTHSGVSCCVWPWTPFPCPQPPPHCTHTASHSAAVSSFTSWAGHETGQDCGWGHPETVSEWRPACVSA